MLLTPATKEIVEDAASGGAWTSRTHRQVSRTGIDGSTPSDIVNAIGIVETSSPVIIVIIGTAPPCGLNLIQDVGDIQQSTSPGLVRQFQKLDAVLDRKFPDNRDSMSISRNIINYKISDSSSCYLYTRCRMNLTADPVQPHTPAFVDLGIATIYALDEGSGISIPITIIRRPTDDAHCRAPNHIFVKLHWLKRVIQSRTTAITIKLVFKFGKKMINLSSKTF